MIEFCVSKSAMEKNMRVVTIVISMLIMIPSFANVFSRADLKVDGKWVTFDDKSQKPSSIIEIKHKGNVVEGEIYKTFSVPGETEVTNCDHCHGKQKGNPVLGLVIIKDMKCQGGYCHGGTITDPRNGKVYRATMRLVGQGHLLKVRGYIGISLFGKTVTWERMLPRKAIA